jgi:hypothetical protein
MGDMDKSCLQNVVLHRDEKSIVVLSYTRPKDALHTESFR